MMRRREITYYISLINNNDTYSLRSATAKVYQSTRKLRVPKAYAYVTMTIQQSDLCLNSKVVPCWLTLLPQLSLLWYMIQVPRRRSLVL